jgi:hypothetical protein
MEKMEKSIFIFIFFVIHTLNHGGNNEIMAGRKQSKHAIIYAIDHLPELSIPH